MIWTIARIKLEIAIFHQKQAIKTCKELREFYLEMDRTELADYMVNVLVEQESVLTYLMTERETLTNEKEKEN